MQQYCEDISKRSERLSLELGDLIDDEASGSIDPRRKWPPIAAAKVENDFNSEANLEEVRNSINGLIRRKKKATSKPINFFKQASNILRVGDIVKINNHY